MRGSIPLTLIYIGVYEVLSRYFFITLSVIFLFNPSVVLSTDSSEFSEERISSLQMLTLKKIVRNFEYFQNTSPEGLDAALIATIEQNMEECFSSCRCFVDNEFASCRCFFSSEEKSLLAEIYMRFRGSSGDTDIFVPHNFRELNVAMEDDPNWTKVCLHNLLADEQKDRIISNLDDLFRHIVELTGLSEYDALQHLFAQFSSSFYISQDFDSNDEGMCDYLADLLKRKIEEITYFSFEDRSQFEESGTTPYILITDTQLVEDGSTQALEDFLTSYPSAHVLLSVGDRFIQAHGVLSLSHSPLPPEIRFLPSNLRHLSLLDSHNKVFAVDNYFINGHESLETFDCSAFSKIEDIYINFLSKCPKLRVFDGSGFGDIDFINDNFMFSCPSLQTADTSGFTDVVSIGVNFLGNCQYFDGEKEKRKIFERIRKNRRIFSKSRISRQHEDS